MPPLPSWLRITKWSPIRAPGSRASSCSASAFMVGRPKRPISSCEENLQEIASLLPERRQLLLFLFRSQAGIPVELLRLLADRLQLAAALLLRGPLLRRGCLRGLIQLDESVEAGMQLVCVELAPLQIAPQPITLRGQRGIRRPQGLELLLLR